MNRQARRAEEARRRGEDARAKMAANSQRIRELVAEGHTIADEADRLKRIIFAMAREQGRIRVRASQLAELGENDRIDYLHQENGDVVIQYTAGAHVPQGRESEPQVGER